MRSVSRGPMPFHLAVIGEIRLFARAIVHRLSPLLTVWLSLYWPRLFDCVLARRFEALSAYVLSSLVEVGISRCWPIRILLLLIPFAERITFAGGVVFTRQYADAITRLYFIAHQLRTFAFIVATSFCWTSQQSLEEVIIADVFLVPSPTGYKLGCSLAALLPECLRSLPQSPDQLFVWVNQCQYRLVRDCGNVDAILFLVGVTSS